jgi:hypothetical protein
MASTHSPWHATCRDTRLVGVARSALLVVHLTASRTVRLPVLFTSVALCFSLFFEVASGRCHSCTVRCTLCAVGLRPECAVLGAQEQRTLAAVGRQHHCSCLDTLPLPICYPTAVHATGSGIVTGPVLMCVPHASAASAGRRCEYFSTGRCCEYHPPQARLGGCCSGNRTACHTLCPPSCTACVLRMSPC